ncbi:MAG: hypothetical protein JSR39_05940 [Verrucomicrobia bacterium]|nr:hypothetical protein [Verrucomicrobiota bacterium]
MSQKLHAANTFFEWELEQSSRTAIPSSQTISRILHSNPIFLQLQYLPFLYADENDAILVSHPPHPEYAAIREEHGLPDLTVFTLDKPGLLKNLQLEPWGHSELIAQWAASQQLHYTMPSWDCVRTVNSKAFSFLHSPRLPQSSLLQNSQEAEAWLNETSGKQRVLKTCFGVSGRGHLLIPCDSASLRKRIDSFLEKEWKSNRPVIAEPWVDRILDFSTQWVITPKKEIEYIGPTLCVNDVKGQYRSNTVGDETSIFGSYLPFLHHHKTKAQHVLNKMANLGYFGHVGIDAMVYIDPDTQSAHLQPIVEINARKTMGWAAIVYQKKHHPDRCIEFQYCIGQKGILPSYIKISSADRLEFKRNITVKIQKKMSVI